VKLAEREIISSCLGRTSSHYAWVQAEGNEGWPSDKTAGGGVAGPGGTEITGYNLSVLSQANEPSMKCKLQEEERCRICVHSC